MSIINYRRYIPVLITIVGVAMLGTFVALQSHAATPSASVEPENGAVVAPASLVSNASASGGKSVKFGNSNSVQRTLNCVPTPATTMTNAVSHLCGFPDATNTGVPAGTVLKRVPQDITSGQGWHYDTRGWIVADTDGAVVEGIDTGLDVNIQANNVTVKNNRIRISGDTFGVAIRHATNAIIQDNDISGSDSGLGRMGATIKDIYGDAINPIIQRNNLYFTSTAIQTDVGLVQDNYIHDMGFIPGDHINGTTSNGGTLASLTIRHNTSFNQFDQTDAISLFEDFGVQSNRIIDNNLMAGGGYCLYAGQNPGGIATFNIKVTNNHFSRLYYPNCGSFGYLAAWNPNGTGNVWSNNIWDDSGEVVNP